MKKNLIKYSMQLIIGMDSQENAYDPKKNKNLHKVEAKKFLKAISKEFCSIQTRV